jgi:hypothetical protein
MVFFFLAVPFLTSGQTIATIAGTGVTTYSGNGVPATAAGLPSPSCGIFDKKGNYYFTENVNSHRVRKIDPFGIVTDFAGNGMCGYAGDDGPATLARLSYPTGIAIDTFGNIYIADGNNHRIRKVNTSTGIISTVAGNGLGGYSGDGMQATATKLFGPNDICFDRWGNMYISDGQNYRVRKVDVAGVISTIAGIGTAGSAGDGGPATAAQVWFPADVFVDNFDNVFVPEQIGNRIRRIDPSGIITTFAGNGTAAYVGDGIPATDAQIQPIKLVMNSAGELVMADEYNRRILRIDASGIIHSIAGTGVSGFFGDSGPATAAQFNYACGIAFDACDNLHIPDVNNRRIRKIIFNPPTTPTIAITSTTTAAIGTTVTVNATVTGAGSAYTIKWFKNAALFSTTTIPTTTYIKGEGTDVITARVVPAVTYCYDSAMSSAHTISETVGVTDAYASSVSVYPNPAYTQLVIVAADPIREIVVTNLLGQAVEVPAMPHGKKAVVQVSHLPTGMYLLKVNDAWVHRFYKE